MGADGNLRMILARTALPLRFWSRVYAAPDGCWLWRGTRRPDGYGSYKTGSMRDGSRRNVFPYRLSFNEFVGPIAPGLEIDHLCRTPLCLNPKHLEAVTHRVNILRGLAPSAFAARKTHCPQGHSYDAKNTYIDPEGKRKCRACLGIRHEARRQRRLLVKRLIRDVA